MSNFLSYFDKNGFENFETKKWEFTEISKIVKKGGMLKKG